MLRHRLRLFLRGSAMLSSSRNPDVFLRQWSSLLPAIPSLLKRTQRRLIVEEIRRVSSSVF